MKILLVKPYAELLVAKRLQEGFLHLEPLELEIVAGGIPATEEVNILDLSVEKRPLNAFNAHLRAFCPDMVCFSAYSTNVGAVKELSKQAKKLFPDVNIVIGGVHATLLPEDFNENYVDIIVRGEGGTAMREIVKRFKEGKALYFNDIALSPHAENFIAKAKLPPPAYPEVNDIPRPRRDLIDRSKYFCVWTSSDSGRLDTIFPRTATLRTSIGCAFSCTFCVIPHLMNGKYLERTPEDIVDEISSLEEDHIYFVDDEMFLNAKRVKRIAELLMERGIKKKYISWARSDTIVKYPEIFRLWKKAGLSVIYVGIESIDEKKLNEYNKHVDISTNNKAISILRELGIMLHAAFIVHPDFETDDFRRLEKKIMDICPAEVTFTVLSPSPGTPFWDKNRDRFICDPYRFYDCMHSVLPTKLPLRRFYRHFGRLTAIALRANPLRVQKIKVPFRDLLRAIKGGTRYIFALYGIYRDYIPEDKR